MNQYDPKKHRRRSIRLKGYDYSQEGLYFVTICVRNKKCLFGEIIGKKMTLNDAGKMVGKEWLAVPVCFPNIRLHEYIVVPNHFHSILEIVGGTKNDPSAPTNEKTKRLGDMVGAFQSITTVEYIRGVNNYGWERFDKKLWQRNYWEHIIRNETAYRNISNYIIENPEKWDEDRFCKP